MKNIIELKGLVKKFGDFTAVDNIDLDIMEKEIFGILGPNGAGKTTAINLILGLLKPTSGSIKVGGLDNVKHLEKIKDMIGFMTQETVVENDLTATQNLVLFCELYHVEKSEVGRRVKEALREADLEAFAGKKAGTFSGGMQKRLSLVRSMMHTPKILILDEPTTGLDVQNRMEMWSRIRELRKEGMTIILTTQYLEEADALCDRIAIIDHGRIKAQGSPSELKAMIGKGSILEIISDSAGAPRIAKVLESKFGIKADFDNDKVSTVLASGDIKTFNRIVDEMNKGSYKIFAISMHLPTLDDVFVKLTGSSLRDSVGENTSAMTRARMMGRR